MTKLFRVFLFLLVNINLICYSQEKSDTIYIKLKWDNLNIKYVSGKVILRELNSNFFYGKYLPYNQKEYTNEIQLSIPLDSTLKGELSYLLDLEFNEFYNEKVELNINGQINKFSIYLTEYPESELEKIK